MAVGRADAAGVVLWGPAHHLHSFQSLPDNQPDSVLVSLHRSHVESSTALQGSKGHSELHSYRPH